MAGAAVGRSRGREPSPGGMKPLRGVWGGRGAAGVRPGTEGLLPSTGEQTGLPEGSVPPADDRVAGSAPWPGQGFACLHGTSSPLKSRGSRCPVRSEVRRGFGSTTRGVDPPLRPPVLCRRPSLVWRRPVAEHFAVGMAGGRR